MLHSEKFTEARSKLSLLFDEAVHGEVPVLIERGGREHGLLLGRDALLRVLSPFSFHTDVIPEDEGRFTLWQRELDVGGIGATLKEARDALVSTVCGYVRDYWQQFGFYRHLPDMVAKEPYVLRLSLVDSDQEMLDVLFGAAVPAPHGREPSAV
jgi:hypothetical protein